MELSYPIFQSGGVKIFCPYGDFPDHPEESTQLFYQLASYCQKIFTPLKLNSGINTMFETPLRQNHLDQMNQNVLAMRKKKDLYLKFDCLVGDIELSCDCFTLGGGELSFNLTDYMVVVFDLGSYSIFLIDTLYLCSLLCQKICQVQLMFSDQIGQLFIREVNWVNDVESMEVRSINE